MPHHRDGALKLLGCEGTRESTAAAVAKWKAGDLEDTFAAAGLPTGMVRSRAEWHAHPQGLAVAELPILEIVKIGESKPEPTGAGPRALSGLRVLDLTRHRGAGLGPHSPSYGADVLLVSSKHPPNSGRLIVDTGFGKLSASLDLRQAVAGSLRARARARLLPVLQAGASCSASRPRTRGRPGIVYVTPGFSHAGPWRAPGIQTIIQSSAAWRTSRVRAGGRHQHCPR
jgi:hypothetical protein